MATNISATMPGLTPLTPQAPAMPNINAPAPMKQTPSAPVGIRTKSPATNITPPPNTLPSAQVAPKDLSGTYANVGGTIYNTQSGTKFANPQDFFKDAGVSDFNNLKFNTNYTPTGKETIYGQGSVANTPSITPPASTPPPVVSSPPVPTTPSGPYTPPNQGTTGVSQGGIIGNLIGIANNETPEVTQARANLQGVSDKYAKDTSYVEGSGIDSSLATGREGILNKLFASQQSNAQTALANALASQGQQISANQSAGQLNAPIVNPQTQGLVSPSSNGTTGSTTSGAPLQSMVGSRSNMDVYGIGTRPSKDGKTTEYFDKANPNQGFSSPQALADFINSKNSSAGATANNVFDLLKNQEFYNKSNNQGFATPQALADFVNQQNGNNNATASNVFDQLNASGSGGDVVPQSDPYYKTLQTAADFLKSNNVEAAKQLMSSMPAAVQAQVYRMAGQGYNPNTSTAQGQSAQDLTRQVSAINAVLPAADANFQLALNIAHQAGINDNNATVLNELQNRVTNHLADPSALTSFREALNTVRSLYAQILGGSSNPTVDAQQTANAAIPDNISLGALETLSKTMMSSAHNRVTAIQNQINSLSNSSGSTGSSSSNDDIINKYLK